MFMETEIYGTIYKITNMTNDNIYIGQTKQGFNKRYYAKGVGIGRVLNYYKKCKAKSQYYNVHLVGAIEKYGINSFMVEENYDIAYSKEELNKLEIKYIKEFNCFKNGYNCTNGGEGVSGLSGALNPFSKRTVQLDLKGNYIKTWDYMQEVNEKNGISKASACSLGYQKSAGGYIFISEEKYLKNNKTIEMPIWKFHNDIKKIVQLTLDGKYIKTFNNQTELANELGIYHGNVSSNCTGKCKSTGDFMFMYENEYLKNKVNIKPCNSKTLRKKIVQVDLNGEYIKEWYGAWNIEQSTGILNSNIIQCCKRKVKSANGYQWFYKEYFEINKEKIINKKVKITNGIEILQLDMNLNIIKIWESSTDAAKFLGINNKNISSCLRHKSNSSGGFKWEYSKGGD